MEPIDLADKLKQIEDTWSPRVVAELNDYQFKLAWLQGEFVWHCHDETDEAFFVLEGEFMMEYRDRTVPVKQGELIVVPKGVEHRPVAATHCAVLLIEPKGVINTGEAGGELTAEPDRWI
ncbi:MAG: cupin domain-containing protein [Gammaproteobacteria bacterium]|nr:cupin domain-containing protein [Gammaproteobacteria bacterium]